jgi:hypothetical protein
MPAGFVAARETGLIWANMLRRREFEGFLAGWAGCAISSGWIAVGLDDRSVSHSCVIQLFSAAPHQHRISCKR